MKNPICVSTGFLYRLFNDRNEIISKIREFSPQGIELSFDCPESLFNFVISKENLTYLQKLQFNSIHAPWKNVKYGDSAVCKGVLEAVQKLYAMTGAKNVVFHPGQITDLGVLNNYDFIASIENMDFGKDSCKTVEQIEAILKENEWLKFTFDFAHALTVSPNDIPLHISKFKDKLVEIHLAMLNRELRDHWFLHKFDSQRMRGLLNYLKGVNAPIVLECVASDEREIQLIEKEIEYVKKI